MMKIRKAIGAFLIFFAFLCGWDGDVQVTYSFYLPFTAEGMRILHGLYRMMSVGNEEDQICQKLF